RQHPGETGLHLFPESGHVEPQEGRAARLHVRPARTEQLERPAEVAIAEVTQGDGRLDQPLVKLALEPGRLDPEILPDLVGLEEVVLIEEHDAGQVARVVRHLLRPPREVAPTAGGSGRTGAASSYF